MKSPPEHWTMRATPGHEGDDEARAGRLLRAAIVKHPLSTSALVDIRSRLPNGERGPLRRRALSIGIAVALFLSGGAVVMSATLLTRWSPFRRAPTTAPITPPAPAAPRAHRAVAEAPVEAIAAPAPFAPDSVSAPPRRVRAPQPIEPPLVAPPDPPPPDVPAAAPVPARPSPIAEEAALLGAALRKLREQDDAAGALALLDEHDGRFATNGALLDEASTTRIEALLRLGRRTSALTLLEARTLEPVGHGRELLASRGELRADAGRCAESIRDFDALLADDGTTDGATERALYGRAACRARAGDHEGARADLEAYVTRFPAGRFADDARTALAR